MNKFLTLIILSGLLINLTACAAPRAKVIAKIIDADTGNIIQGTDVSIGFVYGSGWDFIRDIKEGKSDKDGIFSGSGMTREDTMTVVNKAGYYNSWQSTLGHITHNKLLNRWDPWPCELTVKLRPIKDPVPMYVHSVETSIPEKNKSIRFDLEIGDWVSPYGKGKISDFVFKMKEGEEGYKLKLDTFDIAFSNKLDGIQQFKGIKERQSTFRFPYLAPVDNYMESYQFYRKWQKVELHDYQFHGDNMKGKTFFFRTRTKVDEQGNIISAKYGTLTGVEFGIYKDKFKTFRLIYKLNPDNKSRSLEYNDKNLFKDRDEKGRLK